MIAVLSRLSQSVISIWVVASVAFLALAFLPGEPFAELGADGSVPPERVEALRRIHADDRPLAGRYLAWSAALARGDLGVSVVRSRPVAELILEVLPHTLRLAGAALAAQFAGAILLALLAMRFAGGWPDRAIRGLALVCFALPPYALGAALVATLAVRAGWFPVSQPAAADAGLLSALRHATLPVMALTLPAAGGLTLFLRDCMRAQAGQRHILAARARGYGRWRAAIAALRRVTLPTLQLLGSSLPMLVGGAVAVEVLFAWPGMGRLALTATQSRDLPLALGCAIVAAVGVVLGNLIADLAAGWADPRVRR